MLVLPSSQCGEQNPSWWLVLLMDVHKQSKYSPIERKIAYPCFTH